MPYVNINNVKIAFNIAGEKAKDTILFLHGLGSSGRDWENQIAYFKQSFQVMTIDLRGHGQSDKPNHPYTVKMFADDVFSTLEQCNLNKVHVVGLSLGGMVAFELALDYPGIAQTLTIINSAPAVDFPTLKTMISFYLRNLSVRLFGMHLLSKTLAEHLFPKPDQFELRKVFIQRWLENDPSAYLNSLKAFSHWDVRNRLSELSCPILIMSGDRDYTSLEYKKNYMKLLKNAELAVVEDSGHLTPIDQSEKCNQIIHNFLLKSLNT